MLMSNNEEDLLKIQLASVDQRLRTIVPSDYVTLVPLTTDPTIKKNGNSELINFYQREDHPHRFYTCSSVKLATPSLGY